MPVTATIAQYLWLEVGRLNKSTRQWVTLPHELAAYFDEVQDKDRTGSAESLPILIRPRRCAPVTCALSCIAATDGASSDARSEWRLTLPNASQGGPPYAGSVIRFSKTPAAAPMVYTLDVELLRSPTAELWNRMAIARGGTGTVATPDQRFGYW